MQGFDHADALPLTKEGLESAARQLREATAQEQLKELMASEIKGRKQK